ncbi:hypothetical protein GCM10007103_10470 [Salinimicrobium marinum]|uniref:DUF2975 domain-containing protein n=1 Tax=Salinimicrobium marinum TaxID=680283 RepID=A0A918SA10_9FLAO|nr:hypothetical protein [Salinimicrobium marinum]GHA30842.1 hypothetical protein GCM10007103_10470 [Salinimicrobium marinum]
MNPFIRKAFLGGFVSALIMGIGTYFLGALSGFEAMELFSTSLSGINTLCNTVILGSSTILALMLTLLSLSRAAHSKLNKEHYHRVLTLAKAVSIVIITSVITLLLLNLPITESSGVPRSWYSAIYYISLAMAAIIGGGFIAVVTMLYSTIANVILIVGYRMEDHPLVDSEDVDKANKEQQEQENE